MQYQNQLLDSLSALDYPDDEEYFAQARRAWIRVGGGTNQTWLRNLTPNRKYGFAVRAIDESGAVEPELGWHNWAIFDVQDRVIDIWLSEPSLGVRKYNSSEYETWEVSVAPEQSIRFRWMGDASASGSEPGPSNYGFDIPEPDEETDKAIDGIGGWIGWAERSQLVQGISFPREDEGTTHHFYLKMRAISLMEETEAKCHVAISIVRLSFNRRFLLIDDQRRAPRGCTFAVPVPTDAESDALRDRLCASMADFLPAGEEPGVFESFGPDDISAAPTIGDDFLGVLGTYQTVIWDMASTGGNAYVHSARGGDLARYRGAGGNLLMLLNEGAISPFVGNFQVTSAEPACPDDRLTTDEHWSIFSFPYVHLHLRDCIDKPRDDLGPHAFRRMTMISAKAENARYPDLELRWEDWGCTDRGVWHYEVLLPDTRDPDEIPWYEREPGMEILYRARTYRSDARLDSLPVAWRTFPTREDTLAVSSPVGRLSLPSIPGFSKNRR